MKKQSSTKDKKGKLIPELKKTPVRNFFIALLVVCIVVFGNSVPNKYALDDELYTVDNPISSKGFKALPKIFTQRTFLDKASGYSYRPFPMATFAIEYQLFGAKPEVSHLINLLLYAGTILLLFDTLRKILRKYSIWSAFLVTLLFALHPIHTEVVDNIKCRDELMAFLGALVSLRFFIRYAETDKLIHVIGGTLAFVFAVLCKQSVYPFIASFPLILYFFYDTSWKKNLTVALPLIVSVLIIGFLLRHHFPPPARKLLFHENPLLPGTSLAVKLATGVYGLGKYIQMLLIPHPLLYYYGFNYIPLANWTNIYTLLSLLAYSALAVYVIRNYKKKDLLTFGIAFFLIQISMFANFPAPAPGVVAERFAYSASLGFCIVFVFLVLKYFKITPEEFSPKQGDGSRAMTVFVIILVIYGARDIVRNKDWYNKEALYGNDMKYLDESAKANMMYGSLMSSDALQAKDQSTRFQMLEESKKRFTLATRISPKYTIAWSNCGSTYYFLGQMNEAISMFDQALAIDSNYMEAYFNKGMAYDKMGQTEDAKKNFRKAIFHDSTYAPAYSYLGKIYFKEGHVKEAYALSSAAMRNNTESDMPLIDLSAYSLAQGDTAMAVHYSELAADKNPRNLQRLNQLIQYFRTHNNYEKAMKYNGILEEQMKLQKR